MEYITIAFATILFAVEPYLPVLVAVITSGALSSYTTHMISRRKIDSEATQGFVNAAATATATLEKAVNRLEKELEETRTELICTQTQHTETQRRLSRSTAQVEALTKQNQKLSCEMKQMTIMIHAIIAALPKEIELPETIKLPPLIGE